MTVALVMIVKDEAPVITRCLSSCKHLISHYTICDTGSSDDTKHNAKQALDGIPGRIVDCEWVNFGHNLTEAFALAKGTADWLLRLDADMTAEAHPGLLDWLAGDPDPTVDAWMVQMRSGRLRWRMPFLVRGTETWVYHGPVHEWLGLDGRKQRHLLGLYLVAHQDNQRGRTLGKYVEYLKLLEHGYVRGDPRSTFYTAEALKCLGMLEEAAEVYMERARMNGWEEESWYAEYQAAKLMDDVDGLLAAYARRPWRPEPLRTAADIVSRDSRDDVLFME